MTQTARQGMKFSKLLMNFLKSKICFRGFGLIFSRLLSKLVRTPEKCGYFQLAFAAMTPLVKTRFFKFLEFYLFEFQPTLFKVSGRAINVL